MMIHSRKTSRALKLLETVKQKGLPVDSYCYTAVIGAISLSGAIEGGVYSDPSNYGYLQSLSFQQFLSCSKTNGGCDGGNLALASLYAQIGLFKGITRLNDYPYTDYFGTTTEECLAPAAASIVSGSSSSAKEMTLAVQVVHSCGGGFIFQQQARRFLLPSPYSLY